MGSSSDFSTKIKPMFGDIEISILYPDHPEHLSTEHGRVVTYLEVAREKLCYFNAAQEEPNASLKRLQQTILDRAFRGEL